ncbi:MAG: WYL domain-containing protein, partial [Oscillospiraceae bacterium]|nr:WYL domain-containing protein [Oscillospiraceae bacterium]
PQLSHFLNRMLNCFYKQAESSVLLHQPERIRTYTQWLKGIPDADKAARQLAVQEGLAQFDSIRKRFPPAPKGNCCAIKLVLNKDTRAFLECAPESELYAHESEYLAALIQEYASLHRHERELIFFGDTFRELEVYIKAGQEILLTASSVNGTRTYRFLPVRNQTNGFLPYNYVVGYSSAAEGEPAIAAPFRLQRIRRMEPCGENRLEIPPQERKKLTQALRSPELTPFLLGKEQRIAVRLTPEGYRLFHQSIFSGRPRLLESEPLPDGSCRMEFCCPPEQARQYFLRYGKDAEVLEPPELRDIFAHAHRTAAAYYDTIPEK